MSNIINLADFRKPISIISKDLSEICQNCSDEISECWKRASNINRLNDYFVASIPSWANKEANYLIDLNALSALEEKIKLTIILRAPQDNMIGWVAGFKFEDKIIETMPIHFTEQYARCFNILLFLKVKRERTI